MTATVKTLTPADAPALVVRMPLHGQPARLVSMFGLLMAQFSGDDTIVELDPQETLLFGLLRKRILNGELTAESLIGAYLHSLGTLNAASRSVSVAIDGGITEFKLRRNGCCISLELRNQNDKLPQMVLRFEGATKKLATISTIGGDLGQTVKKKIWTGADGARTADFESAFRYWFQQAVQFEADQKLG